MEARHDGSELWRRATCMLTVFARGLSAQVATAAKAGERCRSGAVIQLAVFQCMYWQFASAERYGSVRAMGAVGVDDGN